MRKKPSLATLFGHGDAVGKDKEKEREKAKAAEKEKEREKTTAFKKRLEEQGFISRIPTKVGGSPRPSGLFRVAFGGGGAKELYSSTGSASTGTSKEGSATGSAKSWIGKIGRVVGAGKKPKAVPSPRIVRLAEKVQVLC